MQEPAEALIDFSHQGPRQGCRKTLQQGSVDRVNLRDVGDTVSLEARQSAREERVSRCSCETKVAGQAADHYGVDSALVDVIALHNE